MLLKFLSFNPVRIVFFPLHQLYFSSSDISFLVFAVVGAQVHCLFECRPSCSWLYSAAAT